MIANFFKPQAPSNTIPSSPLPSSHLPSSSSPVNLFNASDNDKVLADLDLKSDPAERKQMSKFSPNIRDRVRRYYILKKPFQPEEFEFPSRDIGGELHRFNPDWFNDPYSQWLEYSVKKYAAFCLCCYLFKNELGGYGRKVSDAFTTKDLMSQEQSILTSFDKPFEKFKGDYRVRLNASVDVIRYLLKEGMPFRGHNECVTSTRRSHFLDLLNWYADKKEDVKNVVLEKAPKNNTTTFPDIQKDIVNSCAKETVNAIIEDLNGDYFGILVDESKDVSHKEQMALVLRYVNKEGKIIERFLGLVHVKDTSAKSLKEAIYSLLLDHSLSRSQIRGQGYDGASNMQGEINGLKTLILKDNSSAYCVHCFAHQLQLTLVAVAKKTS
ncbi:uncharacterized protein LOC132620031 [Lycium barbarum]|uniref:uncharacterized protein LOC132620031 n=1 Tax=Lycium barbarum TaxID=112863 RepID=UPI00293EB675|nr:uncharacterized protein LOC132620031 [Lycium barbarum]